MEVGILTFSRVHNYGAILQCYAIIVFRISKQPKITRNIQA